MRHENARRRRPPFREPNKSLLLVCGGEITEPRYFDGLKRAFRNPAVRVCVRKKGVDPLSLVEHATVVRDRHRDTFDEVWCVTDVDEFDVAPALRHASHHGIRMAVSNPCFELWLLLHFADHTATLPNAADAIRRLRAHVPDYCKHDLRFDRYRGGLTAAIRRARDLEHLGNPSSGVWRIAEAIAGR